MLERSGRRIISAVNDDDKSVIVSDESITTFSPYSNKPIQMQELFYTEDFPQTLCTRHVEEPYQLALKKGAMRFLKIRMPTRKEIISHLEKQGQPIPENFVEWEMHQTQTADYIYVLSGQIACIVNGQSIELREGDFLAQIGAKHAWINDSNSPCYLLCFMVGL